MRRLALAAVLGTLLCGVGVHAAGSAAAPPPWSGAPLSPTRFVGARVAQQQWRVAGNRATCRAMSLASAGSAGTGAKARAAVFSGGWGVAWDLPKRRSAFGVAGAGVDGTDSDTRRWPHRIAWSDGSAAGYGPEGGNGPTLLAYVHVLGQGCLYNVWSNLGEAHLLEALRSLRFVASGAVAGVR